MFFLEIFLEKKFLLRKPNLRMNPSYKVVLIGDKETGKSSYLSSIRNSNYNNEYLATMGVEVHPLGMKTNCGEFVLKVWDTAGDDTLGGMRDGYYISANACIVFYTENSDHVKTDNLLKSFLQVNPDAEVVIVWGKCDKTNEKNYVENMSFTNNGYKYMQRNNYRYFQVSALSRYNLPEPIIYLLRKLTGNGNLFIEN